MGGMSNAAREANPFAEHEQYLDEGRAVRADLLKLLEKLDAVPEDKRNEDWWADRDEVSTSLRQVEQAIRSGELARTQVEGFAAAMTPATISEDEPQPKKSDTSEE